MKRLLVPVLVALILSMTSCTGTASPSATSTTTASTTTTAVSTTPTVTTTLPTTTAATTTTTTPPATTISTTPGLPAAAVTRAAAIITFSSAVLNGALQNTASENIDRRGFEWGTGPSSYASEWTETGSFLSGEFSHLITGLSEGTVYYFRCKMHGSAGWKYGEELSFRTLGAPRISAVSPGSALVGETVAVTVTGSLFTGVTAVNFGEGITVNNYSVISDTQITLNITIAANAATGPRAVSVTAPDGTGTMSGGFTVLRISTVLRTVTWKNADFNTLLHHLTTDAAAQYEIRFHDGSQMTVISTQSINLGVEVRDGKLVFTNVPQSVWDSIFYTAADYMSYDGVSREMTIFNLPEIVLTTMFDPAEDIIPEIKTATPTETQITVTYYSLGIEG